MLYCPKGEYRNSCTLLDLKICTGRTALRGSRVIDVLYRLWGNVQAVRLIWCRVIAVFYRH